MRKAQEIPRSRILLTWGLVLVALMYAAATLGAQTTDARKVPSKVRVHVADSTGAPVADAEVSLVRGLKTIVASGRTNNAGDHDFIVDLDSSEYSVVSRKIGYTRGDRFFAAERNVVDAAVTMKRIEGTLAPVTVTTPADLKRKSYHIDADDITDAKMPVRDALDVVDRLRPDMILSRSGNWGGRNRAGCPALTNIWVNGRRYDGKFVIVNDQVAMRAKGAGNRAARMGTGNMTILSEISPEHIAEMNYRDCFESNSKTIGSTNALYITLKPGVGYRFGRYSYVVGDTTEVAPAKKD